MPAYMPRSLKRQPDSICPPGITYRFADHTALAGNGPQRLTCFPIPHLVRRPSWQGFNSRTAIHRQAELSMHGGKLVAIMAIFLASSMIGCRTGPHVTDAAPAEKPPPAPAKSPATIHAAKPKPPLSAPPAVVSAPKAETKPETTIPEAPEPNESEAAALREGYACCNLHYEGDWISDSNFSGLPKIPLGTPVRVLKYGLNRAYVNIGGKSMRIGLDYGRQRFSLEQWIDKIVLAEDPTLKLATFPALIQAAIKAGRVAIGMTKEQVIMAIGYPNSSDNPWLGAPVWKMWASVYGKYQLIWDASGKLAQVDAERSTRNQVVFQASD
jgi:hypothetical protein